MGTPGSQDTLATVWHQAAADFDFFVERAALDQSKTRMQEQTFDVGR